RGSWSPRAANRGRSGCRCWRGGNLNQQTTLSDSGRAGAGAIVVLLERNFPGWGHDTKLAGYDGLVMHRRVERYGAGLNIVLAGDGIVYSRRTRRIALVDFGVRGRSARLEGMERKVFHCRGERLRGARLELDGRQTRSAKSQCS